MAASSRGWARRSANGWSTTTTGQLLTATFMDYAMPRAEDMPMIRFSTEPVPSTANPLGMKGCGEAGTVGALAAVTNAVLDALWARGVRQPRHAADTRAAVAPAERGRRSGGRWCG